MGYRKVIPGYGIFPARYDDSVVQGVEWVSLKDVITQLEPGLFKRVTGLSVKDFDLLVSLGVFNSALMNDAVWKFRRGPKVRTVLHLGGRAPVVQANGPTGGTGASALILSIP